MTALNKPGYKPECLNHAPVQERAEQWALNQATGKVEKHEWETPWLKGCPHRRPGGNAVVYEWDCSGCKYADGA